MKYSELRQAARIPLAERVPLPFPFTVYLEPTNVCNFRCTYCPESFPDYYAQTGGKFKLSISDFQRAAASIEEIGQPLKVLNFYFMGEPLINQQTPLFIHEAHQRKLAEKLILTTNASLLDVGASAELLGSGLDYLRVSIYGANQKHFEAVSGSRLKLMKIWENVARFKSLRDQHGLTKPFIYVKMIDSGDASLNAQFLHDFGPVGDEVRIEPAMNWNDDFEGNISGNEALLATDHFSRKKKCCPSPFYTVMINSDLTVAVCCVDWNKRLVIGNLREQSLLDIWRGDKLLSIQRAHLEGRREELPGCKGCSYIHTFPDNLDDLLPDAFLSRRSASFQR